MTATELLQVCCSLNSDHASKLKTAVRGIQHGKAFNAVCVAQVALILFRLFVDFR